jgi:hypothetical protein
MRRIAASFPEATSCLRPWRTRRGPTAKRYTAALVALVAALFPAVSAASAQAPASITDATTGLSDASAVAPVQACAAATAFRATCLAQILGLRGTETLVHPRLRQPSSPYRLRKPRPRGSHAALPAIAAAGAPQPGTPAYLQQAYDLSYLSETAGTTETVAIVDAFDDPNAESDLAAYRAEFGLPACTSAGGCLKKVDQNGGTNYPTSDTGWEQEISLDLDAVSALCPNCHIDLVEANSAGTSDLAAAELEADELGANVISDSWDIPLSGRLARQFPQTGDYTFNGVTTVAASGDAGYPGTSTNDFPAALPDVTAAGGTTLEPASASGVASARAFTESAWSEAGSGCNLGASKPAWQTDHGCTGRSYADISADADPDTGMQIYDSADGGWVVEGGTSEAAPLIAAYYALLGSAAQGPSWAYANASLLNDPSTGSNGACAASIAYICNAGPGYDGPTGVGSISGAVTTGAPGISGPGTNGTYALSATATGAQLSGGVYPNGIDTTYWWEYGPTTAYGQQTPATDIGSGTGPVAVSDTLTGLSPGTTYHYRLVAQNQTGTEYGYDFTVTTPASSTTSPTQGTATTTTATTPTPTPTPTTTATSSPPVTESGSGSSGTSTTPASAPLVTNVKVAPAASAATISATIAGSGEATTYSFHYGPTAALGQTASGSLASSKSTATVTWALRNLSPGKVYYLRAVATNAAGSTQSTLIRFRTSPVTITRIATRGGNLVVVLRCHGSAPCRFRLQGRSGTRLMVSSHGYIRGNRTGTVTLALTRAFETLATHSRTAKLSVLSTWNGITASVTTTI